MRKTHRHLNGVRPEDNSPSPGHFTRINLLCQLCLIRQFLYNGNIRYLLKSEAYLISNLIEMMREFLLHSESFLNVIVYDFIVLKTYNTVADTL